MRHDFDSVLWLRDLRHRMLNILLGATIAIGTPGILYSLWRMFSAGGDRQALPAYLGAYLVVLILFLAQRIPDYWRALGILVAIYAFACLSFYLGWLGSGGRVFLMALIVAASVLIGMRAGLISVGLSLLTYGAFGLSYLEGWLTLRPNNPPDSLSAIVIEGIGFGIGVGISLASLSFFHQALNAEAQARRLASEAQTLLEQRAEELNRANQLLDERTRSAEAARQIMEAQTWQSTSLAQLSQIVGGEQDLPTLSERVIRYLCQELKAQVGGLFVAEEDGTLQLMGSHAYLQREQFATRFRPGVGLVGQAALEKKLFTLLKPPSGYRPAVSGLLEIDPVQIVLAPFLYDQHVIGVLELSLLHPLSPAQTEFLVSTLNSIAVAFHTARTRSQVNLLLKQTQEQASALQIREEMLQAVNEELQTQTDNLSASQRQLQEQQAALEESNAELVEQRSALDQQNRGLQAAQQELQRKTEELTRANQYKSEFLANMSHELRTPLNSLLILARLMRDNESGNLTEDQVESAQIIYNSGRDLLALINEILDLSKIEAGQTVFQMSALRPQDLAGSMQAQFAALAKEKGLTFEVQLAPDLPAVFESDQQRVEQILKNLLGNAFKFTEKGQVRLTFESAAGQIAMGVSDSGIGMTPEQQERIFQAFQQADGSTSRKYGGTGLGLTISRNLALNLGGRIVVKSEFGQGSTFTLYLPLKGPLPDPLENPLPSAPALPSAPSLENPLPQLFPDLPAPPFPDDRDRLQPAGKLLLVIEDDPAFARVLYDHAQRKGYQCLVALDGESGLNHARRHRPDAVLLDLKLPGRSGWEALEQLKNSIELRHIPVHILSASDGSPETNTLAALRQGAIGFIQKPVTLEALEHVFEEIGAFLEEIKTLLIVEDDARMRHSLRQLLSSGETKIYDADSGAAALRLLRDQRFDCMILDLSLPDMTGFNLLDQINQREDLQPCPVIVYTGKALSEAENVELLKYTDSIIIKGVRSPERLLHEVALFLHHVGTGLSQEKPPASQPLHQQETALNGKKILVVDDDMRNVFALRRLLSEKGLEVSVARSGAKALELLETQPLVDLVLMDIMMPEMDGYEAMKRIRAQARFQDLPIIALTAKAMQEDRAKCIAAGANEYISKPLDADRLFSLLRVWLYRS
jgi:CheY-like chemotaxis protein